jgi:apolipoprotein N-acyltransferase
MPTVPASGALAVLSGVLLALSFPRYGHPAFAWASLTPLVVALLRPSAEPRRLRHAFLLGLLTGGVCFSGTLYWLVETMTTFGDLATPTAVFAALLLVVYLSLFPAAFAIALVRLRRSLGLRAAVMLAPPVWVAAELGRQYVWDGFPWALLGYSQVTVLPVAQLASLVGVYGLSGLLALTSASVAFVIIDRGRQRWLFGGTVAALILACAVWGRARIERGSLDTAGEAVRVAVLQGNVLQDDKWNPALRDVITGRYVAMTREAIAQGATFIIWPETATPFYFAEDPRGAAIRRLAREARVTLLVGSDQRELGRPDLAPDDPANHYYNAAFVVKPDGTIGGVYRKMHLVPFGEFVPLKRLLFFVQPIVEAVSSFTPGDEAVILPVDGHRASTAICYEVIFGSLMRQFVVNGSELLTTITNDAWYGRSSAAYQHWEQASMRAIENGRYLARAANTGISGFVDPYGRVLKKSTLFEQALLVEDLRFLRERTLYSRLGDLVAWLSLAVTVVALLVSRRAGPA